MTEFTPIDVGDGIEIINNTPMMGDGKGGYQPLELIKPQHKLEDQVVRTILGYAMGLSDQIARFKEHTFEDISAFEAVLAEEYDATLGGKKGNKTLMSADRLFKVSVQIADHIDFGPELQIAKSLIDECLNEWAADSRPEIKAIVTNAFNTDKEGQINRSEIFMLLRMDIADPRWLKAMDAIRNAMRVVGSKTYVRCYRRERFDADWKAVTIDLAKA